MWRTLQRTRFYMAYLNTLDLRTYPKEDGENFVCVMDNVCNASLNSGMFSSLLRAKNTYSANHGPTKFLRIQMWGFANLFISIVLLRFWCKGHLKATVTPHGGVNSDSKGRKSPATLIYWPLRNNRGLCFLCCDHVSWEQELFPAWV